MNDNERTDCPSSSSLDRLVECSASHNMGVLAKDWNQNKEMSTQDAQFGLNVHEALHKGSAKGLQSDEERMAYSVMHRNQEKFIAAWQRGSLFPDSEQTELREHRMWLHQGVTPVFTGQADYIRIDNTRALILDYKSLWNKVPEPAANHQLSSLAVLLWLSHKELKEITTQIISAHYDYSYHTMYVPNLSTYLDFLEEMLRKVNQANAPVSGEWCKHCRGLLICPAVRKKAADLLKADEGGLFPSRLPKGEAGAKILDDMVAVSSLIDRIRDHYKAMLTKDPKAIPGWMLETRSIRQFNNIRNVFGMLHDKLKDDVFSLVNISVPKTMSVLSQTEQQTMQQYIETKQSAPGLRRKGKEEWDSGSVI